MKINSGKIFSPYGFYNSIRMKAEKTPLPAHARMIEQFPGFSMRYSLFDNRTTITYKSNMLTIRAPARCINSTLPAIQISNTFWCTTTYRH